MPGENSSGCTCLTQRSADAHGDHPTQAAAPLSWGVCGHRQGAHLHELLAKLRRQGARAPSADTRHKQKSIEAGGEPLLLDKSDRLRTPPPPDPPPTPDRTGCGNGSATSYHFHIGGRLACRHQPAAQARANEGARGDRQRELDLELFPAASRMQSIWAESGLHDKDCLAWYVSLWGLGFAWGSRGSCLVVATNDSLCH